MNYQQLSYTHMDFQEIQEEKPSKRKIEIWIKKDDFKPEIRLKIRLKNSGNIDFRVAIN